MELVNFTTELNDVYTKNRAKWEQLQGSLERDRRLEEDTKKNYSISQLQKSARLEALRSDEADFIKKIESLQENAYKSYEAVKDRFIKKMDKELAISPESVDTHALALLNSGILSDSDYLALAEKFSSNPTMLKLLRSKIDNNPGYEMKSLSVKISSFLSPDERIGAFDKSIEDVYRALSPDRALADIEHNFWTEKGYPALRETIENLDVLRL